MNDVFGVAVRELLLRDALQFSDVGRGRRHCDDGLAADLGGELHELGREEVGHDLEVGAAGERAAERILSVGSLSVVEVRPGGLHEHARAALRIAGGGGRALELERGLAELAGVDGLSRLFFERFRAFLRAGGRGEEEECRETGRKREEEDSLH